MSFDSYGLRNMDLPNGEDVESAETITSTLKAVLKINGTSGDASQLQEDEKSHSRPENAMEEEDKKDSGETDGEAASMIGASGGPQNIDLSRAADGECIPVYGDEVTIVTSPNSDTNCKSSGSDKVRIKPITKYDWAHKYYNGTLVSVTNSYMAYAIKTSTSFAVRVISRKNTSNRLLLRGFTAPVCDVAFAHSTSVMIAAVDEDGNFLIWQLSLNGDTTTVTKKLHVKSVLNDGTCHRLVWLTYMHCGIDGAIAEQLLNMQENDDNDDDDPTMHRRLLAVSHGKMVDVWDVNAAFEVAESDEEDTEKEKLSSTFMTVSHEDIVTDCVLSPEGSVIAVASNDGYVKFWQVAIEDTGEPTCLHKWQPHGDRPVSLVTFCDDRTQSQLVLYWRFMLTGCNHNSELKIWCTVSWTCLQTICFKPAPGAAELTPSLKCVLHAAADYLVITDINRKVVYILRCLTDLDAGKACLSSISQYLLTTPILSFAISDARKCKFKTLVAMDEEAEDGAALEGEDAQESDGEEEGEGAELTDEGNKKINGVLIQLVSINSKSLESLDIRFVPNKSPMADESMISYSTYNTVSDELNVVSMDESLSAAVSPSREKGSNNAQRKESTEEDEEEEGGTRNNTVLTGIEGDQSTLLATNEDEAKNAEKGEAPTSPKSDAADSGMPLKDPLRTRVMDLVEDIEANEPPLAHSSPNVCRQFVDPEDLLDRGQGEGEAVANTEDKDGVQPLLLTPDAFTASLRKPEDLASVDSTFTRVTPFSTDHPSLLVSERDDSLQESPHVKSPTLPSSILRPPGFPPISTSAVVAYKPEADRQPTPPLITPASERSSLDMTAPPVSSFHSILTPTVANEPGPFGDIQTSTYMTKGPDLISSASSIGSNDPRALLGAVGGSGDALFLTGHAKSDADNELQACSTSLPAVTSAPWPKAPDVTMSRPVGKKVTPSISREVASRSVDTSQEPKESSLRLELTNPANAVDQPVSGPVIDQSLGADLLVAITNLQKQQEEMAKSIQKDLSKKTSQISRNVEASLKRADQQQNEKLDRALKNMADSQRKFQTDSRAYSASATEQVSSRIDRTVKQEMKSSVLPNLTKSLDPIKDQLLLTVSQKITATDSVLKEQIGKMARSKDTVEAIGNAAGRILQSQVHGVFRDAFMQILVPAMEKSCENMFQQLATSFQRGTNEIVVKLEKQIQSRVKAELERISATEKAAREATAELKDAATHLHSKISATVEQSVQKLTTTEMKRIQETMTLEMTNALQHQHEAALKEQKTVLTECIHATMAGMLTHQPQGRPRLPGDKSDHAGTMARSPGPMRPTYEQHQQAIVTQLQQGNINAAFQRALSASDLALVMYVCELVDPVLVFGASSPCALHQPIILSLIQQLSCDLSSKTVTKLKYLQEAVMNLDTSHQVTQEHMRTVLDALVKNLDAHVATLNAQPKDASNTPIVKEMMLLSMAAKSLLR